MGTRIIGVDNMTIAQVEEQVKHGARFVYFEYCISIIVMTFKRPTDIYFIPAGDSVHKHGIGFTVMSLLLGWWGFPWGPIYTIGSLATNLSGGKDVTSDVMNHYSQMQASRPS